MAVTVEQSLNLEAALERQEQLNKNLIFDEATNSYVYLPKNKVLHRVTTPLNIIAKGYGFEQWLKQKGMQADVELKQAQEEGTLIHKICEDFQRSTNRTKDFFNSLVEQAGCSERAKQKAWGFYNFFDTVKPKLLVSELRIMSLKHGFAGTLDDLMVIDNHLYLVDKKTGKSLHKEMRMQLAAYCVGLEETYGIRVDKRAILHLKETRTGFNFKLVETDVGKDFKMYRNVKSIHKWMGGGFDVN